jgi:monoamine oxidase
MADEKSSRPGVSRRSFLHMVGAAGGAAAVYETMVTLGMIKEPIAWAGPPKLAPGSGNGRKVVILGAGVGGVTAALDLIRAGYTVTILEAQNRVGGRSFTARRGDVVVEESLENGRVEQTCRFDEGDGLYINLGPGRLPYHHRRVLHYARSFNVALEPYVMSTTANYFQTDVGFDGKALHRRVIDTDTRGYIAEMLAKAVGRGIYDDRLNEDDQDRLLDLLRVFGDLDAHDRFRGSTRAGCDHPLTVETGCEAGLPTPLKKLLESRFWNNRFYQPEDFEWQATLFQPIGGMDQLVLGMAAGLPPGTIRLQHVITGIEIGEKEGVKVSWRDAKSGATGEESADFCISNIPLPILSRIKANFAGDFQAAVDAARFDPTCKVGWQADARFWEKDPAQIFGGISYTDHPITQMWYPSNNYLGQIVCGADPSGKRVVGHIDKGTLTGAYNYEENALAMGLMAPNARLDLARQGGARIHPEFRNPSFPVPQSKGISIAWQNVPFQEGGWANWDFPGGETAYERLLGPDRAFYVVGDQVSTLPGWQEGAMMSAEHVVEQIAGMRPKTGQDIREMPSTRRLVQGRF